MAQIYSAGFAVVLDGHAAIVTGAGGDVGRACAFALSRGGAAVCVCDLNPDRAETVAAEIQERGGKALAWQADVSNRFQAAAMIEAARDAFGRVSLLVNAASVFKGGAMTALDEWDWRRVLDVNLTGAFFCTQLISRVMADEGGGVIVNLSATAGIHSTLPDGISYAATKAGVVGMTAQSARELAPLGIRVNAVCLGNMEDDFGAALPPPQNALGRRGTFDESADAVLFLCSDAARFITGQALVVDGGGY